MMRLSFVVWGNFEGLKESADEKLWGMCDRDFEVVYRALSELGAFGKSFTAKSVARGCDLQAS